MTPDHRGGHWPAAEGPASSPPYIPPQNINVNITLNLGSEAAALLRGITSGILAAISKSEAKIMSNLDDILASQQSALEKITRNTDLDRSIAALVKAKDAQLVDLRTQLEAAIAANDPVKIQQVSDNMKAISDALDVDAEVSAVVSNTPPSQPEQPSPGSG